MTTQSAVSPNVPAWTVALSLAGFTVVYGAFAVVEFRLITRAAAEGPEEFEAASSPGDVDSSKFAITY